MRFGAWSGVVGFACACTLLTAVWVQAQGRPPTPQQRERWSTCVSNMKQLNTAMFMYLQDYDQRYPPAKRWSTAIRKYHKRPQLLNCPEDIAGNSYAMNRALSAAALVRVPKPMRTPLLFES